MEKMFVSALCCLMAVTTEGFQTRQYQQPSYHHHHPFPYLIPIRSFHQPNPYQTGRDVYLHNNHQPVFYHKSLNPVPLPWNSINSWPMLNVRTIQPNYVFQHSIPLTTGFEADSTFNSDLNTGGNFRSTDEMTPTEEDNIETVESNKKEHTISENQDENLQPAVIMRDENAAEDKLQSVGFVDPTIISQFRTQDELGGYHFSYYGDVSSRAETRDHDGVVRGQYHYVDPNGYSRSYHYVADDGGFRVRDYSKMPDNSIGETASQRSNIGFSQNPFQTRTVDRPNPAFKVRYSTGGVTNSNAVLEPTQATVDDTTTEAPSTTTEVDFTTSSPAVFNQRQ